MSVKTYRKFTFIFVVYAFIFALVHPLLSPYLEGRGFVDWQISLMFTVFPLINIIVLPFFGAVADKMKRRHIILFGIAIEIISMFLYLIDGHWTVVVLARLLDAVVSAMVALVILAKIEDNVDSKKRGVGTGGALSIAVIGSLIGPLVGSYIADLYGIAFSFWSAIILFLLLALFVFERGVFRAIVFLPQKLRKVSWLKEIKLFLKYPDLRYMGILGIFMHIRVPAYVVFLPLFIVNKLGFSYAGVGIATTVLTLPRLLQWLFGRWLDKVGHWTGAFVGAIATSFFVILIPFVFNYYWLLVLLFIIGIFDGIWNVGAWSLLSDVGEKNKIEAQAITTYYSVAKIGAFVSFLLATVIARFLGMESVFVYSGLVGIMGTIIIFIKKQYKYGKT